MVIMHHQRVRRVPRLLRLLLGRARLVHEVPDPDALELSELIGREGNVVGEVDDLGAGWRGRAGLGGEVGMVDDGSGRTGVRGRVVR